MAAKLKLLCFLLFVDLLFAHPLAENSAENDEVNPEETGGYFEGDMELDYDQMSAFLYSNKRNVLRDEKYRWPGNVVYYEIDDIFEEKHINAIRSALDRIEKVTCLKFRPRKKTTKGYIVVKLAIDEISLNNSGEKFQQNKEMYPPYKPFKISLSPQGTISHLAFKESDPIWSTNFKRAIAATLQFQLDAAGAFVVEETGIHGKCSTEYYIANKTDSVSIRKTPELKTCTPFTEAIHLTRSNVPPNLCEFDFQKNVIVGNEAQYGLLPHPDTEYFLNTAIVKGTTLIHTFESTGEAQYINSELLLTFVNESAIDNIIDIETSMSPTQSSLEFLPLDVNDPTGGRHPLQQDKLLSNSAELLNSLAEGLESAEIKFGEPYDSTVSDIIKIMSQMDFDSLQKLFSEVDIGTSYRQETIRNIFFEIIPRIGTKASVLLTRDLVVNKQVKPPTAVQLLISLPFHIYELSQELVKECDSFLTLGPDRPDVRQAAVLSFATLIHNVFVAGKMSKDSFEEYVQKYFNFYLNGYDYEQKMLYLQALSNLQLGNVANYLDPIIKGEKDGENEDIKFLAAWATMPLAHTRPQKIYELYWPIFESRNATLEMRVAALTLLLISSPTPARLISLHRIIQDETCPHLINFYRTTIKSISETTYPCYQDLRRMLSYMHRHLPPAPESRYWVTGNYIFDYRDSKFGIGAMLQAFLVGDPKSDLPIVAYFKFDTEALGKFTGQLALYIKARGLPDAVLDRIQKMNAENLKINELAKFLDSMKAPKIDYTPLHFEFIVQMEGKTVLSYYLNQKTFHNITYGDLINRINYLIRTDSHINMQTVRWPFMTKYAVPTVLGTPADVLLQTTVLTSLRGNITQHKATDAITRNHQIDVRYSLYASCKSKSYNPFLNLDHEINREQGILVYIPINNELSANITNKCLKFSFTRTENLTSGLAFKSRSVTSTKGYITKSAQAPFQEIISPEKKHEVFQLFKYDLDDLGVSVSVNTNLNELNTYRIMLLKSEFMENGFSKNMIVHALMYMFGVAQLSSIHIGNDRNFTLLVHNKDFTKIEGSLGTNEIGDAEDKTGHKIDFSLVHTSSAPDVIQHKWNVILNFSKSTKKNWFKLIGIVKRSNHNEDQDWKACIDVTYAPLVFMKKPHTLNGAFIFGKSTGEKGCPANSSKIELSATAGPSENAEEVFNSTELAISNHCPKEILKFHPIPSSKYCKRSSFESLTAITNYNTEMKFNNMPEWFDVWSNRLDHFVSAFSNKKVDHLNLGKELDLAVNTPTEEFWLTLDLNGVNWRLYRIPFIPKIDSKYDTSEQLAYDTGIKRSCSLIGTAINTFDDHSVDLLEHMDPQNRSCAVLFVADCSTQPKLAIFLAPMTTSNKLRFSLRVHVGGNFFIFEPFTTAEGETFIEFNGEERINIRGQPYQYPPLEKFYDFRVELNDHNILVIENALIKANIQYDCENIMNVEIYGVYKNKMCGLCSQPLNMMENYNLCE